MKQPRQVRFSHVLLFLACEIERKWIIYDTGWGLSQPDFLLVSLFVTQFTIKLVIINVNLSRPSHRGLGALLFTNRVWFLSQQNLLYVQGLLDGACDFIFLSEKTNKSNHLQMLLQRQNFLPSSLRPWVLVRPVFETATSSSADRLFSIWANQAGVDRSGGFLLSRWKPPINRIKSWQFWNNSDFAEKKFFLACSNLALLKNTFCGHRFVDKPTVLNFPGLRPVSRKSRELTGPVSCLGFH